MPLFSVAALHELMREAHSAFRTNRGARVVHSLASDTRGVAATEFAFVAPVMLMVLFGVIEMTSATGAYRKVTVMAHTLADLASQSKTVSPNDLTNYLAASAGVMDPYAVNLTTGGSSTNLINQTIMEVWIENPNKAWVQWSAGSAPLAPGTQFSQPIPPVLAVNDTYVIYSTVSYQYMPIVGALISATGMSLTDTSFSVPRQSGCVLYDTDTSCTKLKNGGSGGGGGSGGSGGSGGGGSGSGGGSGGGGHGGGSGGRGGSI